jgi:hypothetical protein
MKTVKINFSYEDATVEAFANWLGRTEGDALAYIVERLITTPYNETVERFQKDMALKMAEEQVALALADAKSKVTVTIEANETPIEEEVLPE